VQAIVTMAKAVNVAVTAEGVETCEQLEFLARIGCNDLQGYLLSPPVSAPRLIEIIRIREESDRANIAAA
jgi:EAL domain-containing protein (putative c-di-GMP-specific phosphodiesterase class I)